MFLKRKIAVTTIILGISLMMWAGLVSAQMEIELYVYTDRSFYGFGDEGTLSVTVWNKGGAVDLKNIEVNFPWEGLYHESWAGNLTHEIDSALGKGEMTTYELNFEIPSESRDVWAGGGSARVTLNYEAAGEQEEETRFIQINMAIPVHTENIMPIYYLTAVLTTTVIIVIIELYFVWKRLGKLTPAPVTA
jgi:uncharacterized membrane protein